MRLGTGSKLCRSNWKYEMLKNQTQSMYTIQENVANVANHLFEQWKQLSPELGPQLVWLA